MISRVAGTIADWGRARGYFATAEDGDAFEAELTYVLLHQMAAFNSPVWFNVGFEEHAAVLGLLHPQRRGHDGVDPRLEHQGGQDLPRRLGLGHQPLEHPRVDGAAEQGRHRVRARCPSCAAPTPGRARSSPAARRAARRRWSSSTSTTPTSASSSGARRRRRRRPRRSRARASTCRSTATASRRSSTRTRTTRSASPTSSCTRSRTTRTGAPTARTTGEPVGEPIHARELMRDIAEAAWRCADPGVQYDTTINQWHTSPNSGRINASNPCSEYMHVDDSACNLASLNLMKFRRPDGTFDVDALRAHRRHRLPRAGDRRRAVELPDRGDRRQRPRLPPARPRLREPRRLPDGQRHAVRLRRGSRHGGRDHRADDRPRLPRVGEDRRGARPVRALRGEPRAAQRGHAHAPRRVVRDPGRDCADDRAARRRAPLVGGGRRARRAPRLPQRAGDGARARPGRSRSSWTATRPASSPTSRS